jgi:hypothetical protein
LPEIQVEEYGKHNSREKGRKVKKVKDPGIGYRVVATVIGAKGTYSTVNEVGDSFEISYHNPRGLCGFF